MTAALDSMLSYSFCAQALRLRGIILGGYLPEPNEAFDMMLLWAMRLG